MRRRLTRPEPGGKEGSHLASVVSVRTTPDFPVNAGARAQSIPIAVRTRGEAGVQAHVDHGALYALGASRKRSPQDEREQGADVQGRERQTDRSGDDTGNQRQGERKRHHRPFQTAESPRAVPRRATRPTGWRAASDHSRAGMGSPASRSVVVGRPTAAISAARRLRTRPSCPLRPGISISSIVSDRRRSRDGPAPGAGCPSICLLPR